MRIVLRNLLGLLLLATWTTAAFPESGIIAPRGFEARGVIERVDTIRSTVTIDGNEFALSRNTRISGSAENKQELRTGQTVSYQLGTRNGEAIITDMIVSEPASNLR